MSQVFPRRKRATALSIYLSGSYVGGAAAMIIGGFILQRWPAMCGALPFAAACSVAPWKAALLGVGLPGLPLALLILTISEPSRPHMRGGGKAIRIIATEFSAALPPFTFVSVYRVAGARGLLVNLCIAIGFLAAISGAVLATHDAIQWVSLGIGGYAIVTWGQIQSNRDRPFFRLTFGDRSFLLAILSSSLLGCIIGTVGAWSAPYLMRTFALMPAEIGLSLGVVQTLGTVAGLLLGGWMVDWWKTRDLRAPMWMCIITLGVLTPGIAAMMLTRSVATYLAVYFIVNVASSFWAGGIAALIQDLVLPRMRGSAASCYSLVVAIVMFGFGPYWVGKISTLTGSLATGMLSILALAPIALGSMLLMLRDLPYQTLERRQEIAREAGEPAA